MSIAMMDSAPFLSLRLGPRFRAEAIRLTGSLAFRCLSFVPVPHWLECAAAPGPATLRERASSLSSGGSLVAARSQGRDG
uniref:Uncharacterized protein n=1 Tax=Thermogemmatispora argillosa TaxID=2045280 RepID=A0A455T5A2_9CHLR|nr:hypothetical protein KTA_27410 [Thermogemmatispora argillosa]